MFREDHHSNLVILADGLKCCVTSIHQNALMAESELKQLLDEDNGTFAEMMRPALYKSQQRYCELNLLMYSAFLLESYINVYDYSLNSDNPEYEFDQFSKQSTSQKWKFHFGNATAFLEALRNLFDFRNFLVHSKPIRRTDGRSEVFVKGAGWIPATSVSSFVNNELGLMIHNFSVDQLREALDLVNSSVDLIEEKTPGFNMHYRIRIDVNEQLEMIQQSNANFDQLSRELLKKGHEGAL